MTENKIFSKRESAYLTEVDIIFYGPSLRVGDHCTDVFSNHVFV